MAWRQENNPSVQAGDFQAPQRGGAQPVGQLDWNPDRRRYKCGGQVHHQAGTTAPTSTACRWHRWCYESQPARVPPNPRPSTRITVENALTDSQANKPPLERG